MLKHRIIPILLWDGIQVVQSVQFKRPHRPVGSMMQYIKVMETRNIDELIILDVNATIEKRKPKFEEIKEFTKELFCPVTIGGGITELDDIGRLIRECGADKVAIRTNQFLVYDAVHKFGAQAIVSAIDIYPYHCFTKNVAGELLITSVLNNGAMIGYQLNLIDWAKDYNVPIIINGGCGTPQHMIEAIKCGASAVAASSMFLFTDHTPRSCARALHAAGIPVRLQ